MKRVTFTILLIAIFCWSALAGGYQVRLQGNKQTGMGLIGTPMSFGASSIFYNPAGLSFMKEKFSISVGASAIMANVSFEQEGTGNVFRTDNPLSTPFYLYVAGKIGDKFTIGLGVYTPFGSTTEWEKENDDGIKWPGRYLIQEISLVTIFVQPTVTFQINDKLSLGAGFIWAYGSVDLKKDLPYTNVNGKTPNVELDGTSSDIGFNVGIMYRPNDQLSIGIDYRSKMAMKIEGGDAKFKDLPVAVSSLGIKEANKFDAELPIPANLDIGIAFQANDKFLIAFEINYVAWSTYEELSFTFEEMGSALNSTSKKDYKDSWIVRFGGEYKLGKIVDARLGFYYDPSPVNKDYFNPETVSLNTLAWTAGLSIRPTEKLSVDISFLQLFGQKSKRRLLDDNGNNIFSGTYQTITAIPGLGISYNF